MSCTSCGWNESDVVTHESWHASWSVGRIRQAVEELPVTGVITQRNPALMRLRNIVRGLGE